MTQEQARRAVEPPTADDLAAIRAVALDYIEGWLDGDEARMRRCLHPDLVKRTIYHDPASGDWRLGRTSTAEMMAGWTAEGSGKTDVPGEREFDIVIEDVFRHIASVRVLSTPYMDYLHIAKIGERWFIVHALWELHEGQMTP